MEIPLKVRCKSCKKTFLSPFKSDNDVWPTVTVENLKYRCPECGAVHPYEKADHFFPGHEPRPNT